VTGALCGVLPPSARVWRVIGQPPRLDRRSVPAVRWVSVGCSGSVRHAPDEGRGARDLLRVCEAVLPECIDHPPEDLPARRRAWRLVEEKEPPVALERPAYASQLFCRRGLSRRR
jgi:hypothetical protein